MSKLRILGLSLMTIAMLTFVDCNKGNKNGDEASNGDTLALPSDVYGEELGSDETPLTDETSNNGVELVLKEDMNGQLSPAPAETINSNDAFYIVAGSFTQYQNAKQLNEKLKAKGFESKILEPHGLYHRVTVKQFKTVEEARAALPGLRSQIDQTLWLLTR